VSDAIKTELSVMVVVRSSGPVLSNGEGRMLTRPASPAHSGGGRNELLSSFDAIELTIEAAIWTNPLPTRLGGRDDLDLVQASRTKPVVWVDHRAPHYIFICGEPDILVVVVLQMNLKVFLRQINAIAIAQAVDVITQIDFTQIDFFW
jgi:hypothetical protein